MNTIVEVETRLARWLVEQLNSKGWSHRELGRRAGVAGATVSRVISGDQNPGWDFCAGIAQAFGEPTEKIFRLAGLLPPEPKPGPDEDQLLDAYRDLSSSHQQFIIDILRGLRGMPRNGDSSIQNFNELNLPTRTSAKPPDLEEIMDLAQHLDEPERWMTYDFIQWRLIQQEQRRDSNGMMSISIQDFYRLYRAMTRLTPVERDAIIQELLDHRAARLAQEGDKPAEGNSEAPDNQEDSDSSEDSDTQPDEADEG